MCVLARGRASLKELSRLSASVFLPFGCLDLCQFTFVFLPCLHILDSLGPTRNVQDIFHKLHLLLLLLVPSFYFTPFPFNLISPVLFSCLTSSCFHHPISFFLILFLCSPPVLSSRCSQHTLETDCFLFGGLLDSQKRRGDIW